MPRTVPVCPGKHYVEHILMRCFHAGAVQSKQSERIMMSESKNLSALANTPTRRQLIAGVAIAFGGLAVGSTGVCAEAEEEISHTAESIHQEAVFKASRKRVYE